MKFGELNDEILLELRDAGFDFDSNATVDAASMEVLQELYPDIIVPQQEMNKQTGQMETTLGQKVREATPTSDEWTPKKQEKVGTKLTPESEARMNELTMSEDDGIFIYTATGAIPTPDGKIQPFSKTWRRKERYSPADQKSIENAFKGVEGVEFRDFGFKVDPEPGKKFAYMKEKGLLDPNVPDEQILRDMAGQPALYEAVIRGEDPSSLGNLAIRGGQMLSMPIREITAKAAPGDQSSKGELYREMARLQPKPGSNFLSSMVQGVGQSPFAAATLATGGLGGGGTVLGNALRTGGIGAVESALDMAAQEKMGLADYSAGDYAGGIALGSVLGGAGSLPAVAKAGMGKLQDAAADPNTFWRRNTRDLMPEQMAKRAKAKAQSVPLTRDQIDQDKLNFFAQEWGVDQGDLFPGLASKTREGALARDLKTAVKHFPAVGEQWRGAWDKMSNSIDEITNYSTAPEPPAAGALMKDAMQDAQDNMFNSLETSYAKIAADDAVATAVDRQLGKQDIGDLYDYLNDLDSQLKNKFPTSLKEVTEGGETILKQVPEPIDAPQYAAVEKFRKNVLGGLTRIINKYDDPRFLPGTGEVYRDLEKARQLLSQTMKNQSDPRLAPEFKLPDIVTGKVQDLYSQTKNVINKALENVDPELAAKLDADNAKQTQFFELRDELRPYLTKKSDAETFSSLWKDFDKADKFKQALSLYGLDNQFNTIRDAWFKKNIVKTGKQGDLSDSWLKNLKSGDAPKMITQFYDPNTFGKLQTYAETMSNMGYPGTLTLAGAQGGGRLKGLRSPADLLNPKRVAESTYNMLRGSRADIPASAEIAYDNVNRAFQEAVNYAKSGTGARQYEGITGVVKQELKDLARNNPFLSLAQREQQEQKKPNVKKNLWRSLSK